VLRALEISSVLVARDEADIVGTVRLEAKKSWAIDVAGFVEVPKSVYLCDFEVLPEV
jgi:hypothetical protein